MIKFFLIPFFIFLIFSCSEDKASYNSTQGGHNRSNNYEDFSDVFSNYIKYKPLKFDSDEKVDSSGFLYPPFMLNSNDYIYISKENKIHIVIDDRVMSSFNLENNYIASNPCKDEKENVYFQAHNGAIYSYNLSDRRKAKFNWKTNPENLESNLYSDLVYFKDKIYSTSTKGGLKVFNTKGELDYSIEIPNLIRNFSISDNEVIYISTTQDDFEIQDTLYAIKDNEIKFKSALGGRLYTAPVCVKNEIIVPTLYEFNGDNYVRIHRLNEEGKEISKIENNIVCKYISSDNKGEIYTISSNAGLGNQVSYLNKYDKEGKRLWTLNVDLDINSPMLICSDVAVFCGERDGATGLFYIDKNNGKLLSSIALSSVPLHSLVPIFKSSGGVVLGTSNKAGLIVIERSSLDKVLR